MNKNIGVLVHILVGVIFSVQAADFSDNFDRSDVSATSSGPAIGSNYVISSSADGSGLFQISGNELRAGGGTGLHDVLSYQGFETLNDQPGQSFDISVEITLGAVNNGIVPGLAFNYQDEDNFYFARMSTGTAVGNGYLQIGQVVGGTAAAFSSVTSLNIQTGVVYQLAIQSSAGGVFEYTIDGGTVSVSNSVTDSSVDFADGYAGIYQNNGNTNTRFDNLSIHVTEPVPVSYPAAFSDDFARADVAATTSGAAIGDFYVISGVSGDAQYQVSDQALALGGGNGTHCVLSYQGFEGLNSNAGYSFNVSVDIKFGVVNTGISSGLAFNYQDATNYYFARMSTGVSQGAGYLQIGQVVDGALGTFGSVTGLNIQTGVVYQLAIQSTEGGTFDYAITGGTVSLSDSVSDANVDFVDGYVGIYQNNANTNTRFDNFSINSADSVGNPVAEILSFAPVAGGRMEMTVYTDSPASFSPVARESLVTGTWTNIAHSDSTSGTLVMTNLDYAATVGSNRVIYVSSDADVRFFRISSN